MFSGRGGLSRSEPIFLIVDGEGGFDILTLDMARIHNTSKSSLALRKRKRFLLSQLKICPDSLRASLVERFSRCGKANCQCHHGGHKHGPFYYLTQCLAVGKVNKFLLKSAAQQQSARDAIEHYRQLQEQLEELSQINTELLRREENLGRE